MLHDDTIRFLHRGCGLIVASVGADGAPCATRGWGLTVLDPGVDDDGVRVRLLLDADDARALDGVTAGRSIAITAADVPTLRSIQMKGTPQSIEPATPVDLAKVEQYADDFFDDISRTDGTSRHLLDLLVPSRFTACVVAITDTFDQTPGPGAGAPLAARQP